MKGVEVQALLLQEKQSRQAPEQNLQYLQTRLSHTLRKLVQVLSDERMCPHAQHNAEAHPVSKIQGGRGRRIQDLQNVQLLQGSPEKL